MVGWQFYQIGCNERASTMAEVCWVCEWETWNGRWSNVHPGKLSKRKQGHGMVNCLFSFLSNFHVIMSLKWMLWAQWWCRGMQLEKPYYYVFKCSRNKQNKAVDLKGSVFPNDRHCCAVCGPKRSYRGNEVDWRGYWFSLWIALDQGHSQQR